MNAEQLKRANILGALMRLDVKRLQFKQEEREVFTAIGHMLRKNREEADVSLREVARRIGKSAPFVSDVELGRRNPTISFCDDYLNAIKNVGRS